MRAPRTLGLLTGLIAALAALAGAAPGQAPAANGIAAAADRCPARAAALVVQGSTLCVVIDEPTQALRQQLLLDWIERSARIVADYYARFPAPLVELRIRAVPGGGVGGGRTTNESGLLIQVSVGREITPGELAADWVLVHEMVHLALPELGRRHNWLAEGLATYVEGIARAIRQSRRERCLGGMPALDAARPAARRGRWNGSDADLGAHVLGRSAVLPANRYRHPRTDRQSSRAANGIARHLARNRGIPRGTRH